MAAPIVYRWDDANAPVARGERRSLCDILRACLVDGYGTKPAAGWTLEYINATEDRAAFRNNPLTGTGFYLQVDGATSEKANVPIIRGFEVMTSDADGLGAFYSSSLYAYISNGEGTTARPWILIADERAFYFIPWINNAASPPPEDTPAYVGEIFFGDGIAVDGNDAFFCCIAGAASYTSYQGWGGLHTSAETTTSPQYSFISPRSMAGLIGQRLQAPVVGGGPGTAGGTPPKSMGAQGPVWTTGMPVYVARPFINDAASYTLRGWPPGLYYPCHSMSFGQFANVSVDGRTFLSLRFYANASPCNCFISLDNWRA